MFGATMFIPLFAQSVLGMSAMKSGFITTPMTTTMMGARIISGLIMGWLNKYRSIALVGYSMAIIGMGLLALMGPHVSYQYFLTSLVVSGCGFGITVPVYTVVPQNVAAPGDLGIVTSAMQFFRHMGGKGRFCDSWFHHVRINEPEACDSFL
jgi:hypothetical protein